MKFKEIIKTLLNRLRIIQQYVLLNLAKLVCIAIVLLFVNWYLRAIIIAFLITDIYKFILVNLRARFLKINSKPKGLKILKDDFKNSPIFYTVIMLTLGLSCYTTQAGFATVLQLDSFGETVFSWLFAIMLALALLSLVISLKHYKKLMLFVILFYLVIDSISISFNWFYFYNRLKAAEQFDYTLKELPIISDNLIKTGSIADKDLKINQTRLEFFREERKTIISNIQSIKNNPKGTYKDSLRTIYFTSGSQKRDIKNEEDKLPRIKDSILKYKELVQEDSIKIKLKPEGDSLSVDIDNLKYMTYKEQKATAPKLKQRLIILSKSDEKLKPYTDKLIFPIESPVKAMSSLYSDIFINISSMVKSKENQETEKLIVNSNVTSKDVGENPKKESTTEQKLEALEEGTSTDGVTGLVNELTEENPKNEGETEQEHECVENEIETPKHEYWDENKPRVMKTAFLYSIMIDLIPLIMGFIAALIYKRTDD